MLLEIDRSTTRQDVAELVPQWRLHQTGVCKIEFTLILRNKGNKSDILEHHVMSLAPIRDQHYHNCALAAMNKAEKEMKADLKAKNKEIRASIKAAKALALLENRSLTLEELQIQIVGKQQFDAEVCMSGHQAWDHFQSTVDLSSMVVVREGVYRPIYFLIPYPCNSYTMHTDVCS